MLGSEAGIGHRMVDFPDLDSLKKSLLVSIIGISQFGDGTYSPSYGG